MDKISKKKRSWNMSRIKGKDTSPELRLRKELFKKGYRYRLHFSIPGRPDIVFPKKKIAIFVHGCFWHQHGCKNTVIPKTNTRFWQEKLLSNVERDRKNIKKLKSDNWKTLVVWECELEKHFPLALKKVEEEVKKS